MLCPDSNWEITDEQQKNQQRNIFFSFFFQNVRFTYKIVYIMAYEFYVLFSLSLPFFVCVLISFLLYVQFLLLFNFSSKKEEKKKTFWNPKCRKRKKKPNEVTIFCTHFTDKYLLIFSNCMHACIKLQ